MSRVEELPDDYDENTTPLTQPARPVSGQAPPPSPSKPTKTSNPSSTKTPASQGKDEPSSKEPVKDKTTSTKPDLPPPLASIRDRSAEEVASMMNRTPLFMTSMDETDGSGGENIDLEALKALAYEGTPTEVAKNFKEQGNERYQAKFWNEAVEFYTKGLAVLEEARKGLKGQKEDGRDQIELNGERRSEAEEIKETAIIAETLLVNRAACNLELQNYRRVTQDCTKALSLNPANVKAHYRLASAHFALSALPAATEAINAGLRNHPKNAALLALQNRVAERQAVADAKQREVSQREQRQKTEAQALAIAVKARGIRARMTDKPPELEDALVHLEKPDDPTSTLFFPTLFLYPVASQSDLIKAMPETDLLQDHLEYLFPAPWDTAGEYSAATVDCYMETTSGGLAKVGKKMALRKMLAEGNVEVVDGLVKVLIVPRAKSTGWIEDFKKMRIRS